MGSTSAKACLPEIFSKDDIDDSSNTVTKPLDLPPQEQKYVWTEPILSKHQCLQLLTATGDLGSDPSSQYFVKRTKNIAYCARIEGRWFQLHINYFNQNADYNDFSGGYKRYYQQMPVEWIDNPVIQQLLNAFQTSFNIPDNRLILVQIQKSHISCDKSIEIKRGKSVITVNHINDSFNINPDSGNTESIVSDQDILMQRIQSIDITELQSSIAPNLPRVTSTNIDMSDNIGIKRQMSITGQGIHSDGKNHAMLVCLERDNIEGAMNSAYYDLEGDKVLMEPFVLEQGRAMFWHDNRIYHYVGHAQLVDEQMDGSRTVLLMHYPAIFDVDGSVNPDNTLTTNKVVSDKQLRKGN